MDAQTYLCCVSFYARVEGNCYWLCCTVHMSQTLKLIHQNTYTAEPIPGYLAHTVKNTQYKARFCIYLILPIVCFM